MLNVGLACVDGDGRPLQLVKHFGVAGGGGLHVLGAFLAQPGAQQTPDAEANQGIGEESGFGGLQQQFHGASKGSRQTRPRRPGIVKSICTSLIDRSRKPPSQ